MLIPLKLLIVENYTYASIQVVKGLTFVGLSGGGDINDIAEVVISPFNGHGSDAPSELGSAGLMIVTDFDQTERGTLTVKNDYRQFGILKNPLLNKKTSRLRLVRPGATGSFVVGATSYAFQGITGTDGLTSYNRARGSIEYWSPGVSGYTGSAELVVSGISGNFLQNGIVYAPGVSFGIQDVIDNEIAGTEARRMLKLKLASLIGNFAIDGSDFKTGLWVSSVGNPVAKVKNTRFTGSIYRWEPSPTSLSTGYLYVEHPSGRPLISEGMVQTDYYLRPTNSLTGTAKVIEIEEIIESGKSLYDQITKLELTCSVSTPFDSNSFVLDSLITSITGATATTGRVLEWSPTSEILGVLALFDVRGSEFVQGSGLTFNYGQSTATATVSSVLKTGDLRYKSGELEYIQNMTAISRSTEQREEIKVLFQL